jgi:hypothetical protein
LESEKKIAFFPSDKPNVIAGLAFWIAAACSGLTAGING